MEPSTAELLGPTNTKNSLMWEPRTIEDRETHEAWAFCLACNLLSQAVKLKEAQWIFAQIKRQITAPGPTPPEGKLYRAVYDEYLNMVKARERREPKQLSQGASK